MIIRTTHPQIPEIRHIPTLHEQLLPSIRLNLMISLQMAHQPMDRLEAPLALETPHHTTLNRDHAIIRNPMPHEPTVLIAALRRPVSVVPFLRLAVLATGGRDAWHDGLVGRDVAAERRALAALEAALARLQECHDGLGRAVLGSHAHGFALEALAGASELLG